MIDALIDDGDIVLLQHVTTATTATWSPPGLRPRRKSRSSASTGSRIGSGFSPPTLRWPHLRRPLQPLRQGQGHRRHTQTGLRSQSSGQAPRRQIGPGEYRSPQVGCKPALEDLGVSRAEFGGSCSPRACLRAAQSSLTNHVIPRPRAVNPPLAGGNLGFAPSHPSLPSLSLNEPFAQLTKDYRILSGEGKTGIPPHCSQLSASAFGAGRKIKLNLGQFLFPIGGKA